jgi:hypothetical protein
MSIENLNINEDTLGERKSISYLIDKLISMTITRNFIAHPDSHRGKTDPVTKPGWLIINHLTDDERKLLKTATSKDFYRRLF